MPRKCIICNSYDKNSKQSFYSFPKDDGRKKLWLKACGIDLYLPSYKVCEAHFSSKDFLPSGLLKNIAIPRNNYIIQPEPPVSTNTVFESSHQETLSPDTVISTNSICETPKKRGSDKLPDVSFPKDEVRKKLWLKACKIKLCLPSNKICGDHFLPKHYSHSGYLLKNAVPFLASTSTDIQPLDYKDTSSTCPSPSPMKSSFVEPVASTSKDVEPLDYPMMNCTITYSPCQSPKHKIFNANTIGVLSPSHFSSPRNAKRHLDMVKCKFKEKQVQNSNLKKQIKRLKKKIEKDQEYIQSLNRLLKEREHKEILNANIIEVLSPSQLSSAIKTNRFLDMKKNKFKEKQIQNENLKNQIKRSKNYTVQQDHNYI